MSSNAATINQTLTDYARGIAAEQLAKSSLANFICPALPVGQADGQYKDYSDGNFLRTVSAKRGTGGRAKRLEFDAADKKYAADPYALEIGIDDIEKKKAGEAGIDLLRHGKINTLVSTQVISRELDVFSVLRAAKTAEAGLGVWSNAAKDPIDEIDKLIEDIATNICVMPNRILFGLGAWRVFRNHANVKSRLSGLKTALRPEDAPGLFMNPNIQMQIGVLPYDTTKPGGAGTKANIVGKEVWLFYASDVASPFDASFAKSFRMRDDGVMAVKEYRDEGVRSDIYALDWTDAPTVTTPGAGARITLS